MNTRDAMRQVAQEQRTDMPGWMRGPRAQTVLWVAVFTALIWGALEVLSKLMQVKITLKVL